MAAAPRREGENLQMWSWRRGAPAAASEPVSGEVVLTPVPLTRPDGLAAPASAQDQAVDTIGAILRAFGQYAFDLATLDLVSFRRDCEAWALHVLVGGPRPGLEDERLDTPADRRDYAGLRRF